MLQKARRGSRGKYFEQSSWREEAATERGIGKWEHIQLNWKMAVIFLVLKHTDAFHMILSCFI